MKRIIFILLAEMSAYLFGFGTLGLQEVSHELQITIQEPVPKEQRYFLTPEGNLPIQQEEINIPKEKTTFVVPFSAQQNMQMTALEHTVMLHHDEYHVPPEQRAA